jgi:hypothetical protein
MGHFSGYFEGAWTFLTPLKISLDMAHKVICPQKKNNLPHFQNQRYIYSKFTLKDESAAVYNSKISKPPMGNLEFSNLS